MSNYRRALVPGGTFFFTITLADRSSTLLVDKLDRFRLAYVGARRSVPFETIAICVLPDHLHAVWALPPGDADYSTRWARIKSEFSAGLAAIRSHSQVNKRERGIWQRRFWEHQIRDDDDPQRHVDYIHFNPVKHGHVQRAVDWPHSSFHQHVKRGWLPDDWGVATQAVGRFGE
ncbi:MAG TPA: transposase [Albitalea sp.]|uniref:REP-associated tyrosine transposase n=1 Tax=Piscinibacter sp. TaxID=1903157 RepID=UPI002ED21295